MKTCFKCGEEKPLSEFYRHPYMGDGHLNKCKECNKRDSREAYHQKASDPQWLLSERRRTREKERRRRAVGLVAPDKNKVLSLARWRSRNKNKAIAHQAVDRLVRAGVLKRKPCEICGKEKVEAHHPDYTRPLYVRWLCIPHHAEEHVRMREKELLDAINTKKQA